MGTKRVGEMMSAMKQIIYFGLSTFFLKALGFALLPISTRILSQTEFGELNFLVSLSAVMSLLLCLGSPELLFKQQMKTSDKKCALFRDAFVLCAFISSIFLCGVFYFIETIVVLLPVSLSAIDIKLLGVNLALSSLLAIAFCYFRYYEMAKLFCMLAILQGLGQTVYTIIFLYLGYGVTGVMVSGVVSSGCVLLIAILLIFKHIDISFSCIGWTISRKNTLFLLSIIISSLFVYANNGAENWFIAASSGKEKLAQYYVALQFAMMTSFTFEPVRMWWFARRFKELENNRKGYVYLCELSLEVGVLLCALMIILAPYLFVIVLPASYQLNTWLLPSLIAIVALRHHSDLLNIGCYTQFNGVFVTLVNAISAFIVIVLLYLLVPKYALSGVVISLAVAQLVKTLLFISISQQVEYLAFSVKRLIPIWLCFFAIFILSVSDFTYSIVLQVITFVCFSGLLLCRHESLARSAFKSLIKREHAHD